MMAAVALGSGCGGSSRDPADDAATDATTMADSTTGADATNDTEPPASQAFVRVTAAISSGVLQSVSVIATDARGVRVASSESRVCTYRLVGPCTVWVCEPITGTPAPTPTSVGTITLTARSSGRSVQLEPSGSGVYTSATRISIAPGETVDMVATGADQIPPFAARLTGPSRVTLASGPTTFSRTAPLEIAWDGTTEQVRYDIGSSAPTSTTLSCIFPGVPPRTTVPASALSLLPCGESYTQTLRPASALQFRAGAYTVLASLVDATDRAVYNPIGCN